MYYAIHLKHRTSLTDATLPVGSQHIEYTSMHRNMSVLFDEPLFLDAHVYKITADVLMHMGRWPHIRRYLNQGAIPWSRIHYFWR